MAELKGSSIIIRLATADDQPIITSLIHGAGLNPRNLQWPRFLVAEDNGRIVGLRQVKIHKGGTREVASGLVVPEYRHRQISARLMHEILARERGPLYLMCDEKWANYYEQFGFRRVAPDGLPPDFGKQYRIGRIVTTLLSFFTPHKVRIIPMKHEGWSFDLLQ